MIWNLSWNIDHYRYLLFFRFYLAPYTLYKIYLIPQWQGEIRGDIPETQSRTLEGKFIHTNQRNIAKCPQVKCLSPFDLWQPSLHTKIGFAKRGAPQTTCHQNFIRSKVEHFSQLLNLILHLDVDECLNDPCDVNAQCINTKRSFRCECNTGYSGDGFTCTGKSSN
jgi:hypothetical protein